MRLGGNRGTSRRGLGGCQKTGDAREKESAGRGTCEKKPFLPQVKEIGKGFFPLIGKGNYLSWEETKSRHTGERLKR